jgi:hypothetical protein
LLNEDTQIKQFGLSRKIIVALISRG